MSDSIQVSVGNASPDYFNGRRVENVKKGGAHEAQWTIYYEGGGSIANFDPDRKQPTAIKGAAQTQVILTNETTELRFGLESVLLTPRQYGMIDATYTRGLLVYPQRAIDNVQLAPAHPDERVVDGPTGPEEVTDGNGA